MIMTEKEMDEQIELYEMCHPEYNQFGNLNTKKVYSYGYILVEDEKEVEFLINAVDSSERVKKLYGEEFYQHYVIGQHDMLRAFFKLPDELFGIRINEDRTAVVITLFEIKPNKEMYYGEIDTEIGVPYILVESE